MGVLELKRLSVAGARLRPGRLLTGLAIGLLAFWVYRPAFSGARPISALGLSAGMFLGLRRLRADRMTQAGETTAVVRMRNGDSLLIERTIETVEAELREKEAAFRQLQETYRGVARLHREQKTQIALLQIGQKLLADAATVLPNPDGCAALLESVMEFMEAGGGVVWLRVPNGDSLTAQAAEGRILPVSHFEPIDNVTALPYPELKALCEARLAAAAPAVPPQLRLPLLLEDIEESLSGAIKPGQPTLVVFLRAEPQGTELGEIIGAVGLCDPRGASRFNAQDSERVHTLAPSLAQSLRILESRRAADRRLNEVALLYDLSRLIDSATDIEQVYKAVVTQIMKILPCENCTLFLLDKPNKRLEPRATRGRAVNLLEHFVFEKGQGVSGWVASRGKQVVIHDLDKAPNVLNVESLPARIRSFVAMPMRVHNTVVGVLHVSHADPNIFSPDDIALLAIIAGQAAVTIERTEELHNLETLAITDGLTRTYNHRYFQMRLEDELKRCKRYRLPLSMLIIDVDHFKAINDQYGHASGDAVLRDMGTLLRQCMRDTEIVARWGGEEFGVLLPQTSAEQAYIAAERLRVSVETRDFRSVDGQPIRVTISLGLAGYPVNGAAHSELIEAADRALYAAKRGGRNRVGTGDTAVAVVASRALIPA